jgi:hypothetical protein
MTTDQAVTRLRPLRSEVAAAYTRVLDKLPTGATADECQGVLDAWQQACSEYLSAMESVNVPARDLDTRILTLHQRLETGYEMPVPESSAEAWKLNKHFEKLLSELETVCDLRAGVKATRFWLLAQNARLRRLVRRDGENNRRERQRRQGNQELPLEVPAQTRSAHYAS